MQPWAGCVRVALARERCCGPMEHKGSIAHMSSEAQRVDSSED